MRLFTRSRLSQAILLGTVFGSGAVLAQQDEGYTPEIAAPGPIEEVVVTGRLKSVAASIVDERIDIPFSADFLGFEAIARAGDSTIAGALRRLPGLTLIDNKFVYIRGLGERYSSVTVNGAVVRHRIWRAVLSRSICSRPRLLNRSKCRRPSVHPPRPTLAVVRLMSEQNPFRKRH